MALLTSEDLVGMDYSFFGDMFIHVPINNTIDLYGMDYSFWGYPFIANSAAASDQTRLYSPSGGAAYGGAPTY